MVGVTNTTTGRDMIFWDDSELWPSLKDHPLESLSHIRPLPLFENEEEVKDLFALWAYNGGISIPLTYMRGFIQQLKRSIANPCLPDSKTRICQYRFAILNGKGLKTADIKREFQNYIRRNYKPDKNGKPYDQLTEEELQDRERRKREVANFVKNVEQNLNYFYAENGPFKKYLKKVVPKLEDQEIERFQNHLRNICPKPDNQQREII